MGKCLTTTHRSALEKYHTRDTIRSFDVTPEEELKEGRYPKKKTTIWRQLHRIYMYIFKMVEAKHCSRESKYQ